MRINDDDRASLHPLIQDLARTRTRVPQQRDAATLSRRRRAGPSQCLVSGLGKQRGSVDDERIRLRGDFREAVDSALSGTASERVTRIGTRSYNLIANPVMGESGVRGAVIVLLDVTEREESERMRREFTANVSHELKTPLTAIEGYAVLLGNRTSPRRNSVSTPRRFWTAPGGSPGW